MGLLDWLKGNSETYVAPVEKNDGGYTWGTTYKKKGSNGYIFKTDETIQEHEGFSLSDLFK